MTLLYEETSTPEEYQETVADLILLEATQCVEEHCKYNLEGECISKRTTKKCFEDEVHLLEVFYSYKNPGNRYNYLAISNINYKLHLK
jgi:hypothetical protein